MKKSRVGFVGCGGHARGCNIPVAARNPNLEIRAFCDLREETLNELRAEHPSTYATTDMERIFSDPEVDLVVCATKPDCRLPVVELAARHRKPLFVEKPMAFTQDEAEKIIELTDASGIPFIVGFNRPHSPMLQAIRPIFRRHKKGNTLIVYRIVGEHAIWPPEHRRNVMENKESTVIHETTHIFDLLTWLNGGEPTSVFMSGGGHIDNAITLQYEGDTTAVIIAGDNGSVGYPKERMEIDTNCGTIVGDFFVELRVVGCGEDDGTTTFPYAWHGETINDGIQGIMDKVFKWRTELTEEKRLVGHFFGQTPAVDKGHYGQLEYFRRQIESGEPVETDARRGATPTLIAERAMESWRTGQSVKLDFSSIWKQ